MFTRILTGVAAVVAVAVVGVLGVAALQPDTFRVQRTASIQAPPERIYALLDDFHRWEAWSPYDKLDPAMKKTFSGTASGLGAVYEWSGDDKAGTGRMEIKEATVPSRLAIQLQFIKPFEASNTAEFTLEPQGGATKVTWAMSGPNPFVAKVFGLFCNMDQMIGKDFEAGLASLKTLAEK